MGGVFYTPVTEIMPPVRNIGTLKFMRFQYSVRTRKVRFVDFARIRLPLFKSMGDSRKDQNWKSSVFYLLVLQEFPIPPLSKGDSCGQSPIFKAFFGPPDLTF